MHKEKARAFFTQGMAQVRETGDEALLAYLLGFGCHYLLDSSCHPFVNEMNDKGRKSPEDNDSQSQEDRQEVPHHQSL